MSVLSVARAERRQAEQMLAQHCKTCLSCARWQRRIDGVLMCDIGPTLTGHVERMKEQEKLLKTPAETPWLQDELF